MGRRRGWAVIGALGLGVLSMTGCSSASSISSVDVQKEIAAGLSQQVGGQFAVACPTEIPAEEGYTFTCTATDGSEGSDGSVATVTVTQEDADGSFTWEVTSVEE